MAVLMAATTNRLLPRRPRRHTGWGMTAPSVGCEVEVNATSAAGEVLAAGPRGVIGRGLGRSYGDAAQNGGGTILRLPDAVGDAVLHDDGSVTVPAGVSLDSLLRQIVPRGFFVPVSPGTRQVTVGGAIASDIHGKNHHRDGSFGDHVRSLRLLVADGSTVDLSANRDPELLWATIGGMGLTGLIVEATIQLLAVETSRVSVDTVRLANIDALMETMEATDHRYRYSVAWIDLMAGGQQLGRSVLTSGDHAALDQLDSVAARDALAFRTDQRVGVPLAPPRSLLNRYSVAAFNEAWFRTAPQRRDGEVQSISSFFHPLDMVGGWNRLYGQQGMVQYQCVVPFDQPDVVRTVVDTLSRGRVVSFLAVLKRFGAANVAPLSFPMPGWTLALDVPAGSADLAALFHRLDEVVLDAGGRHYLAKDAHITPEVVRRGYPRLAEWQAVQRRVDPNGRWQSDLSRRLRLTDPAALPS